MGFLFVFVGAGLGGMARHAANLAFLRAGMSFPYGTLTINVAGSLLMGVLVGYFALRGDIPQGWRLFLTTGVLGGFTTFSAFSLEAILLFERGDMRGAAIYVFASVLLSMAALVAGMALTRGIMNA